MLGSIRKRLFNIRDTTVMFILLTFFAGAVTGSVISHANAGNANWWAWMDSFLQNFGTEMFGGLLTFWLIEVLRGARKEQEATEQVRRERLNRLVVEVRHGDNSTVLQALEEMRLNGWLRDGTIRGLNFVGARMSEAGLQGADLRATWLNWADLSSSDLEYCDLRGATLSFANLRRAHLRNVQFQGTTLWQADLQSADLMNSEFDEKTVLPDGSNWTPETDLHPFTSPTHPQFWRSDQTTSPASANPSEF